MTKTWPMDWTKGWTKRLIKRWTDLDKEVVNFDIVSRLSTVHPRDFDIGEEVDPPLAISE